MYQNIHQYSFYFHYCFWYSPGFLSIGVWINKLGISILSKSLYYLAYITDVSIIIYRYAVGLDISSFLIHALCTLPIAHSLDLIIPPFSPLKMLDILMLFYLSWIQICYFDWFKSCYLMEMYHFTIRCFVFFLTKFIYSLFKTECFHEL